MDEDRGDGPSAFHRPQKPVDHPVHFRRVEQERVMAERAFKLDKADRRTRRIERMDDLPRFPGGIEPVGIEGYHAKARVRALRSEERSVGKEGVSTFKSRGSPEH